MIIALAIFAMVAVMIAAIYLGVVRAQRQSKIEQRIQAAGRVAMEKMTQMVRDNTVDYEEYGGAIPDAGLDYEGGYVDTLYLQDAADETLQIDQGAVEDWVGDNVKIAELQFFISPLTDPFAGGGPDEQPRVTILLVITDKDASKAAEQASIRIQTTVSPRVYLR